MSHSAFLPLLARSTRNLVRARLRHLMLDHGHIVAGEDGWTELDVLDAEEAEPWVFDWCARGDRHHA